MNAESTDILALANRAPTPPAEYRQHILATQIFPTIERWGFEKRFHREIVMPLKQRQSYERTELRMCSRGAVVALVGERGLGKTSICAQFALAVAWRNHENATKDSGPRRIESVIYKKAAKLIARYKPLFADFGSTQTEQLLESLEYLCREQEYLVIDEVHECDDAKFKTRILTDLIDRRYSACRDTILIANQTPEDFAATIGDSILSRLNEHGCIIECKWGSFRTQAKEQARQFRAGVPA